MSKNITISEGTQAKNFNNVAKIRTNLIGGGTQNWVPEDEAGKYANVDEITITENGTYSARDEDLDGFSTVRVSVSGGDLIAKTITENGTYYAVDDGASGYSQVTVNGIGEVTGMEPIASGGDGNEHFIKTDPLTGEIEEIVLPSAIDITTLPSKMSYEEGETISITGIVVKAYKNDGTLWTNDDYSDGIIPISELSIEPTKAYIDQGSSKQTDGNGLNVVRERYTMQKCQSYSAYEEYKMLPTGQIIIGRASERFEEVAGFPVTIGSQHEEDIYAEMYLTVYNNELYWYGITGSANAEPRYKDTTGLWRRPVSSSAGFRQGEWGNSGFSSYVTGFSSNIPVSTTNPLGTSSQQLYSLGCDVVVKWKRVGDNKTLTATYGVIVTSN